MFVKSQFPDFLFFPQPAKPIRIVASALGKSSSYHRRRGEKLFKRLLWAKPVAHTVGLNVFSLNEFPTTLTDENAMANAAIIGLSVIPNNG